MGNELDKAGTVQTQPPAQTGGGSPAPQPGAAGTPPAASPAGAPAGSGGQPQGAPPRTYTGDEVSNIVRERLADEQKKYAPYKELGDPAELRARLEEHKRWKETFQGPQTPQPSPEEVELRELLTKQFPGIDKVNDIAKKIQAMEDTQYAQRAEAGRGIIAKLANEKLGVAATDAGAITLLEGAVAASIQSDKAALAAWLKGDMKVLEKHFENVLTSSLEPLVRSASAKYSAGKAKDMAEVPPAVPRGGVQAPTSEERKLSPEERRAAAWKRVEELNKTNPEG